MGDRILKWTLAVTDRQTILMPGHAKILTLQMQFGHPQIWAQFSESGEANPEPRVIAIYSSGNPMPRDPGRYIGTFQMESGMTVWHAYEAPIDAALSEWEDTIRNWTYDDLDSRGQDIVPLGSVTIEVVG